MSADKVLPELRGFNGKLLRTTPSDEQEARLGAALEDAAAQLNTAA